MRNVDAEVIGLTPAQYYLAQYFRYRIESLDDDIEYLWSHAWIVKDLDGFHGIPQAGERLDQVESAASCKNTKRDLLGLANQMRQIFPEGRKGGSPYTWRDSPKLIAQRLQIFFSKFDEYTDEQILEATRKYVESFSTDKTYMQLLKYFIWKRDLATGEYRSDLAALIENPEQDINNDDWTTTMVWNSE